MNIFLRELKANLRSLLIWIAIVIFFISVGFSKFSAYEGNPEMLAILDSMPSGLIDALNMKAFNLTTVTGFFGVMFVYFSMLLTISAAMWGADVISKEQRDRTVEFSLTLPVTRSKVVTAKIAATFVNCVALLLATWSIALLNAAKFNPDSEFYRFVALTMLALFFMQMIFLSIGIFLGCALKQYKRASSTAVSLLLATYFISIAAAMNEKLDFLKYVTPFKYFDPGTLLHESKFEPVYLWLSALIIVVALAGSYFSYSRRDLYI